MKLEDISYIVKLLALLAQKFDKLGDKVIQNIRNIDIASLKSNMSKNHTGDFNVDTVAFGIDNDGRGTHHQQFIFIRQCKPIIIIHY